MQRVLILGCGGAGKSTLAARLSRRTGLPIIHLDAHHHDADWRPMPDAEWDDLVAELARGDRWIMDGNYASSLHRRLPRADTAILLDRHPLLCAWRVLRRRIQWHGRRRPGAPEGAVERIDLDFLHYILTWRIVRRDQVLRELAPHRDRIDVHHLTSDREVERFLSRVPTA